MAVESISPSTFEDFLLEFGKLAVEYEIASVLLLELAKSLPAFQLEVENPSFRVLCYTGFSLPKFKKVLVLPRIVEDLETKLDRVARLTVITNESFAGFPFHLQISCDLFWVIRVERGRNWGMRARTVDPAMCDGRVSAY